jgi:hypothetical protein
MKFMIKNVWKITLIFTAFINNNKYKRALLFFKTIIKRFTGFVKFKNKTTRFKIYTFYFTIFFQYQKP